jgi:hypothetical protein
MNLFILQLKHPISEIHYITAVSLPINTASFLNSLLRNIVLSMNRLIVAIILLYSALIYSHTWNINGYVPSDLNKGFLEHEYQRIITQLKPNFYDDTAVITLIFYKQSQQRLLGIRLPEWGGGGALGPDSIVIPVDKTGAFFENDYHKIISHELVHIALTRIYGNIKIPRWFHEGLAMTMAAEISFDDQVALSWAVLTNGIMDLGEIEHLNRFDLSKAKTAYSVSHFAVQFLLEIYGADFLPELLDAISKKHSFNAACI